MQKKFLVFRAILILFSVLLFIVGLEIFSAFVFKRLPEKYDNGKRMVEMYVGQTPSIMATIEPHPYILFQNTKSFFAKGFLQHNSLRYRNKEFDPVKKEGTTRILVLGGSTTYMYPWIKNPKDIWTARLEELLNNNIGSKVEVINAGQSYATTAEMLASYMFRHQYLQPDILIVHAGINDVASLMFDHYDPEYTHFRFQGAGSTPRRFERTLLRKSKFLQLFYAFWLNTLEPVYKSQPFGFMDLPREEVLKRVENTDSLGFRRNLETLIRYAQSSGVKVILFGELQAREENLSRNRPEFKGLEKAKVIGLKKHYDIMQDLAVKYHLDFIKPDQGAFKDDWFLDNCHLNEEGEAVKASMLNRFFLDHKEKYF